jgi:antitoxin component YwqK of YwqJK toxin-antitoxin module
MPKIRSFLLLLFLISCKTELKKTLVTFPDGNPAVQAIYPDKSDTTSGRLLIYYPNGKIYKEAILLNNQYVNRKVTYYKNGNVSQIDSLTSACDTTTDLCDGIVVRYYENGNISQRYIVKNNAHNGLTQQYASNGKISKEYELINDTIKNGIYHEFYDNGKIAFECNYKNDTIAGYGFYFNENGDTIKYYNHFDGMLSFPYKKWLDNGQILYGDYTDKLENSVTWIWLDKSGKEIKREIANSKKEGFIIPE